MLTISKFYFLNAHAIYSLYLRIGYFYCISIYVGFGAVVREFQYRDLADIQDGQTDIAGIRRPPMGDMAVQ